MSTVIHCTKIDHVTIHDLVVQYADQLSPPVLKNLRKLIIDIDGILNGKDNVTVFLYISGLPKAICLKVDKEKQELPIVLEEDGIYQRGTVHHGQTTFWENINQFGANLYHKCIEGAGSIVSEKVLSYCSFVVQSPFKLFDQYCLSFKIWMFPL